MAAALTEDCREGVVADEAVADDGVEAAAVEVSAVFFVGIFITVPYLRTASSPKLLIFLSSATVISEARAML